MASVGKKVADGLHKATVSVLMLGTLGGIWAVGYGVYSLYVVRPRVQGFGSYAQWLETRKQETEANANDQSESAGNTTEEQAGTNESR